MLRLKEFDPAGPGRKQVRVQVRAAAANAIDWKIRNGERRPMTSRGSPRGVGHDFAGVVEAVGDDVTRLHVGIQRSAPGVCGAPGRSVTWSSSTRRR